MVFWVEAYVEQLRLVVVALQLAWPRDEVEPGSLTSAADPAADVVRSLQGAPRVDAAAGEPSAVAECCTDASMWVTKEVRNHLNIVK